MMNDYSWKQRANAISDMEEKNIRGKGHKSSAEQLRDIGYRSVYSKAFLPAADYIEELETKLKDAKSDAWKWKNQYETLKYGD